MASYSSNGSSDQSFVGPCTVIETIVFYSVTNEENWSLWDLLSIICCAWNKIRAIRQLPEKLSVFSVLLAISVVGRFLHRLSCVVFYLRKSSTWRYVAMSAECSARHLLVRITFLGQRPLAHPLCPATQPDAAEGLRQS